MNIAVIAPNVTLLYYFDYKSLSMELFQVRGSTGYGKAYMEADDCEKREASVKYALPSLSFTRISLKTQYSFKI
jgi:hypothetical protein